MFRRFPALRLLPGLAVLALALAACTNPNDLDEPLPDLGDFRLGHNVVVTSKMKKVPISREATPGEFKTAMEAAIDERFRRYEGDRLYHLGVSVEGYLLAPPGIPIVLSPKSGLIVNVTAWDDAAGAKINDEPEQITVMESFSTGSIIGSGYTQTREEQITNLTRNAAKQIELWLLRNREWFGAAPGPRSGETLPAPGTGVDDPAEMGAIVSGLGATPSAPGAAGPAGGAPDGDPGEAAGGMADGAARGS